VWACAYGIGNKGSGGGDDKGMWVLQSVMLLKLYFMNCVQKHLRTDLRTPYVYFFISYLLPLSVAIASDLCTAQEM
jgi:hypothetical protein